MIELASEPASTDLGPRRSEETALAPKADPAGGQSNGITPDAWRIAAAGVLVGGFGLGYVAATGRLRRLLPALTAGVALGSAVPIAVASRRPPISPRDAERALAMSRRKPVFSVVVGARNEASALPRLVADLSRQDYRDSSGARLFELIVVDDRSTDGTAEAALAAAQECGISTAIRVVRRSGAGLADGKGAALTAAQPDICRGDVVVVLDADARLEPQFLRRAAGYFEAGAPAVTARRRILSAERGWLEGAQADEQTLDGEINRGRWAMGGCSEFRGNGIMIRRDLLAEVGGWRASALTEDTDLASRVAAATGKGVAWAIDAEVWEEPVSRLVPLWNQRKRWAEGAIRRFLEHGPSVLRSSRLSLAAKADFVTYGAQLVVPPIVLGAATGAIARRRGKGFAAIVTGYFGASAILAWDSLRWAEPAGSRSRASRAGRAGRALRVTVFNGLWLLAVPRALANIALSRGPIRYVKMDHEGVGEPEAPGS
jgi:glycosyltransferase involved in cell wall biosynthesis